MVIADCGDAHALSKEPDTEGVIRRLDAIINRGIEPDPDPPGVQTWLLHGPLVGPLRPNQKSYSAATSLPIS
jgi:hypothetical protein